MGVAQSITEVWNFPTTKKSKVVFERTGASTKHTDFQQTGLGVDQEKLTPKSRSDVGGPLFQNDLQIIGTKSAC